MVEKMSVIVESVCECITTEICLEKMENIIVSCLYRKPGSNIETSIEITEKKLNMYAGILT